MATIAELTEKFIEAHPSIKDSLKERVINYSKLSRKIAKESGIEKKSIGGIIIACRRYAEKLGLEKALEERILKIIKNSELEIKNKIVTIIVTKRFYHQHLLELEKRIRKKADLFIAIEGVNAFTIITSEKYLQELKSLFKHNIVKISKGLAMITVKSPQEIESTPGVINYLYSVFAEHGVNIVETMSCWTDTIFVVSEKDVPLAIKYLRV